MRLIDADELMEHASRDKLDTRELIFEMINNAQTVKAAPNECDISQVDGWIERRLKAAIEKIHCTCTILNEDALLSIAYEIGLASGAIHQCLYKELAWPYMKKENNN